MVTKGFKQGAIAFVTSVLTRQGYIDREAYSAERIHARKLDWWIRKAKLKQESCCLCGQSVDVLDIAVATRKKRTSYAKRTYWIIHEHCLIGWLVKHPLRPAQTVGGGIQ